MSLGTMLWGEILFFPLQERVRQAGLLRRSAVASAAIFPNRNKKGMKEFAVRWRISKFFHAVGWIIVLFLLNVFQTVKCYCRVLMDRHSATVIAYSKWLKFMMLPLLCTICLIIKWL